MNEQSDRRGTPILRLCGERLALLPIFLCFGLFFAGCAASSRPSLVGVDAISPESGRWISVVQSREVDGEFVGDELVLIDRQREEVSTVIGGERYSGEAPIGGTFDPNGNYLLTLTWGGWRLTNVETREQSMITDPLVSEDGKTNPVVVWSLPNNRVLIQSIVDGLMHFYTASIDRPRDPNLEIKEYLHIFSPQSQVRSFPHLGKVFGNAILGNQSLARFLPPPALTPECARPREQDRIFWLMIDVNGSVVIMSSRDGIVSANEVSPGLNQRINDLMNPQLELLDIDRAAIEQEIQDNSDEELTPEELAFRVEVQIRLLTAEHIASTFYVEFSPDGTKLLITRIGTGNRYYLDLIDRTSGESSQSTLSIETEWIPHASFSPDGKQIIFESNLPFDNSATRGHWLYLANADGTGIRRIVEGDVLAPCWH